MSIPNWRERVGDWREGTVKISGHTENLIRAIIKDMRFVAENEEEKRKLEIFQQRLLEDLPTVMPMVHAGLIEWAFKQMGSSYPKYLTQAFWDWMTLSQLLQDSVGIDALEALLHTPFNFPLRARKNPRLTFSRLNEKYEPLARKLRKIKGQHRDDPNALRYDIHETLPDAPEERLNRYVDMEPSQIALDYMCWKYGLNVRPEALKKIILVQKNPMKLAKKFMQDYRRDLKK